MADTGYVSMTGAQTQAIAAQARLANSVFHAFKSGFLPSPTTTKAQFEAQECDFDGYLPVTIAAWGDPVLAGVGWMTYAPTVTIPWTLDTDAIGNEVGGHWIETAGGVVQDYVVYDPGIPVQGPGMALIKTPVAVFRAG